MGSIGTVTIGTNTFSIYGSFADAGVFHSASLGDIYDAWAGANQTLHEQERSLVEFTRQLNNMPWAGAKSNPLQPFAFPRTGLVRNDGSVVDSTTVPDEIVQATYVGAALLLADPSMVANALSGSNVASVGAGPAQVRFFRPTIGVTGRWPTQIADLINQFIGSGLSDSTSATESYGTCETSEFDTVDGYRISRSI